MPFTGYFILPLTDTTESFRFIVNHDKNYDVYQQRFFDTDAFSKFAGTMMETHIDNRKSQIIKSKYEAYLKKF